MNEASGLPRWIAPAVFVLAAAALWLLVQQRDDVSVVGQGTTADRALPEFTLPTIEGYGGPGLSSAMFHGKPVSVVNLFASWCIPCLREHRYILELAAMDLAPVYGINLRDDPEQARRWLADLGDGYAAVGADRAGEVAAQLGVPGIPTTLVIDGDARVRYVHIGPLTESTLNGRLVPAIRAVAADAGAREP